MCALLLVACCIGVVASGAMFVRKDGSVWPEVPTYAGFNLSTETLSRRPMMSKVKYLSDVEIIQKVPLYSC